MRRNKKRARSPAKPKAKPALVRGKAVPAPADPTPNPEKSPEANSAIVRNLKPRMADSMKAAAAMLGMSIDTVKQAKADGCPAFRGSRVDLDEFLKWTKENTPERPSSEELGEMTKSELELQKLRVHVETAQFNLDTKKGLTVYAQEVVSTWLKHLQQARAILLQIPAELAPRLPGRSVVEVEKLLQERIDAALESLRKNPYGH